MGRYSARCACPSPTRVTHHSAKFADDERDHHEEGHAADAIDTDASVDQREDSEKHVNERLPKLLELVQCGHVQVLVTILIILDDLQRIVHPVPH